MGIFDYFPLCILGFFMKITILLIFITLIFYSCSKTDSSNSDLASFKGGTIHQSEYVEHYLLSTKYKPEKLPTEENLKEIVLRKSLEKIAVIEAKSQKLEQDSLYQHIIRSNERRLLSQKFVQSKIIPSVITDSVINKFYKEFSPQYRMKYIMRPFLKESSASFIDSQKKKIEEAYKMLRKGEKFENVVKQYSQDITTNKKGGDLGWMIRESMGDEALREVFDTLNQFAYSKPFKGYGGYYILYKGEKREVNIPTLESVKQKIWKTLYHSRLAFVNDAIDKEFKKLSQKYRYIVYTDVINKLLNKIDKSKNISKSASLNFNKLSDEDKKTIIAKYDTGNIMVEDLFTNRKRSPTNKQEFIKRLKNIAQQHLFAKYAKEINLQNEPELKEQLDQMKTSLLRTILYQKMVKDKVQELLDSEVNLKGAEKVRKKTEFEKKLRTEFENKLKTKFQFKFETQNFKNALEIALQKKKLQNEKNKK
jgi:foldase protein PrsA